MKTGSGVAKKMRGKVTLREAGVGNERKRARESKRAEQKEKLQAHNLLSACRNTVHSVLLGV